MRSSWRASWLWIQIPSRSFMLSLTSHLLFLVWLLPWKKKHSFRHETVRWCWKWLNAASLKWSTWSFWSIRLKCLHACFHFSGSFAGQLTEALNLQGAHQGQTDNNKTQDFSLKTTSKSLVFCLHIFCVALETPSSVNFIAFCVLKFNPPLLL